MTSATTCAVANRPAAPMQRENSTFAQREAIREGRFDKDRMLASFEQMASGNARIFTLSRIYCRMDWAIEDRSYIDDLVEFESRVNDVCVGRRSPSSAIPTSEVEPGVISGIAATFSIKIVPSCSPTSERRYPYLMPVNPAAEECLLVPFYVGGKAIATIWGISTIVRRKFDPGMTGSWHLWGNSTSSAYQALAHIEDLKIQVAEREKAEGEVRQRASGLQAKVRRLVESQRCGDGYVHSRRGNHRSQRSISPHGAVRPLRIQQKHIADELDQQVAQRTAELAAANAELQLQVGRCSIFRNGLDAQA